MLPVLLRLSPRSELLGEGFVECGVDGARVARRLEDAQVEVLWEGPWLDRGCEVDTHAEEGAHRGELRGGEEPALPLIDGCAEDAQVDARAGRRAADMFGGAPPDAHQKLAPQVPAAMSGVHQHVGLDVDVGSAVLDPGVADDLTVTVDGEPGVVRRSKPRRPHCVATSSIVVSGSPCSSTSQATCSSRTALMSSSVGGRIW